MYESAKLDVLGSIVYFGIKVHFAIIFVKFVRIAFIKNLKCLTNQQKQKVINLQYIQQQMLVT